MGCVLYAVKYGNCRRKKFSSLEAPGDVVSAPTFNFSEFRPFFLISATLRVNRVGSPYFVFRAKLRNRQPEVKNATTLKRLKVETYIRHI